MNKIIEHTEITRRTVHEFRVQEFNQREGNGVYIRQILDEAGKMVNRLDTVNDKMDGIKGDIKKIASNFKFRQHWK